MTRTTQIVVAPAASSSGDQTVDGIILVEVVGGAASVPDGAFVLGNSPLIAGDYEHELASVIQGADKLFVLKSKLRAGGAALRGPFRCLRRCCCRFWPC